METSHVTEYVIELSIGDIRKLLKQAQKSPIGKTRMIVNIPSNIKTVAYDSSTGVKAPVQEEITP